MNSNIDEIKRYVLYNHKLELSDDYIKAVMCMYQLLNKLNSKFNIYSIDTMYNTENITYECYCVMSAIYFLDNGDVI